MNGTNRFIVKSQARWASARRAPTVVVAFSKPAQFDFKACFTRLGAGRLAPRLHPGRCVPQVRRSAPASLLAPTCGERNCHERRHRFG